MTKQLYVIEFSSANYAGAPEYCTAWASTENEASDLASDYMENFYYEQDADQFLEENGYDNEDCWSFVNSVELMEESEHKEFYEKDPDQYYCVN